MQTEEPLFWMVARNDAEKHDRVRVGESAYFSGLYIDDDNRLALVDPDLRIEDMVPSCRCCTHTFNGKPFIKKYPQTGQNIAISQDRDRRQDRASYPGQVRLPEALA